MWFDGWRSASRAVLATVVGYAAPIVFLRISGKRTLAKPGTDDASLWCTRMSIAVDQTRLRRIVQTLLPAGALARDEATTILKIAQLAAGVELDADHAQRAMLQAIAQQVCSLVGEKPGLVLPIPSLPDAEARASWLRSLAAHLETRGARELAYALAFLVSVGDLELTPAERTALEEFQHALGLDHRRATDLVVLLTNNVSAAAS